jgi:predicted nucleotidyltransferase
MTVTYTEREAATIRDFVRRRVRARERSRIRLLARARSDCAAIIERMARELSPARIYQWGSLVQGSHFGELSDIDLAVEGVADPRKLHELHGDLQRMTSFDLDIIRLEGLQPAAADHIRRRGRVVYEAAG